MGNRHIGRRLSGGLVCLVMALFVAPFLAGSVQGGDFLTAEERAFLREHKRIHLVYDWKYPPFEFLGDDGRFSGLSADLLKDVEAILGVEIMAEPRQDWPRMLEDLRARKADMEPGLAYTPERAQFLLFTDPYVRLPTVIFTQKGFRDIVGLADLRGLRVGAVKGYVSYVFLEKKYRETFTIVPVDSVQEGLRQTSFGELDAFVENIGTASYYIEKDGLQNLRVAASTEHETALSVAVRGDMPLLHAAVQKAMDRIPRERKKLLLDKWVSPQYQKVVSLTTWLYATISLLSLTVFLFAALLLRSGKLRNDYKMKVKELGFELKRNIDFQQALRDSEEKYRAIFHNSPIGMFRSSYAGRVLEVNSVLANMLGYGDTAALLEGIHGLSVGIYPRPEDRQILLDALRDSPKGVRLELQLKRKNGEIFPAIMTATLQFDEAGNPSYLDGAIEDISERRLHEQEVQRWMRRLDIVNTVAQHIFYDYDLVRDHIQWKGASREVLGLDVEELDGPLNRWASLVHPDEIKHVIRRVEEVRAACGVFKEEYRIRHKDGHYVHVHSSGLFLPDETGKAVQLLGVLQDITERKHQEQEVRRWMQRLDIVNTVAQHVFYDYDLERDYLQWKGASREVLGLEVEELDGPLQRWSDLVHPDEIEDLGRKLEEVRARCGVFKEEYRMRHKDGHYVYVHESGVFLPDETGKAVQMLGVLQDITERRNAEEAQRASEARFRAFMDYLPGMVIIKDADLRPIYCNLSYRKVFPAELWMGKTPGECFPPGVAARIEATDRQALAEGFLLYDEERVDRKGAKRLMETRKFRIEQAKGPNLLGNILIDITERRYNEEKHRVLFESSPDAIFLIKNDRIVDCNPQAMELYGCTREQFIGRNPGELSPPIQPGGEDSVVMASRLIKEALGGEISSFEWQARRCDGSNFTLEVSLTAMQLFSETFVVSFIRDISERKQMQELMIQTEKMMSVGGLAAGMAHELNNPLGIIMQSVENMRRRFSPDLPGNVAAAAPLSLDLGIVGEYMRARNIDEYLRGIREAGDRAAKIIRTMLDFSRSSQSVRASVSINAMLDTAVALAANDYDLKKKYDFKSIRIERDYDASLEPIECTETEIVQVLLNIIKNAAQAMPGRGRRAEAPALRLVTRAVPGAARIEIADNGPGMPEATRKRVFEPFFTTKPQGEGTGLGLSVAFFIVTQKHKGRIAVESLPGVGTTFVIELPLQ